MKNKEYGILEGNVGIYGSRDEAQERIAKKAERSSGESCGLPTGFVGVKEGFSEATFAHTVMIGDRASILSAHRRNGWVETRRLAIFFGPLRIFFCS